MVTSSSSSSSSGSSNSTRPPTRRRGRKRSSSIQSRTTSVMTRRQLREASRIVPREFVLFLPPEYSTTPHPPTYTLGGLLLLDKRNRVFRTTSLKLVLAQLVTALKRNAKTQRPRPAFTTASQNGTIKHAPVTLPSTSGKRSAIPNDVPRVGRTRVWLDRLMNRLNSFTRITRMTWVPWRCRVLAKLVANTRRA